MDLDGIFYFMPLFLPPQAQPACVFVLNRQEMSHLECPNIGSFPAFSGVGKALNHPLLTDKRNIGAIPEGKYYIVPRPQNTGIRRKWGDLWRKFLGEDRTAWLALYQIKDTINAQTINDQTRVNGTLRTAFRLHNASFFGLSSGCVTLPSARDYRILRNALTTQKDVFFIPQTPQITYGILEVRHED